MYLTGDQTAITNNAWFHVTGTGTCQASYDGTYTHLSYTSASSPAKVVTVNYASGFTVDTSMDLISGVLPTSSGASVQLATLGGDPTLATLTDGLAPAQILNYDGKILKMKYHGACGCCPGAMFATLPMIEGILKKEFNPDIKVEMA